MAFLLPALAVPVSAAVYYFWGSTTVPTAPPDPPPVIQELKQVHAIVLASENGGQTTSQLTLNVISAQRSKLRPTQTQVWVSPSQLISTQRSKLRPTQPRTWVPPPNTMEAALQERRQTLIHPKLPAIPESPSAKSTPS